MHTLRYEGEEIQPPLRVRIYQPTETDAAMARTQFQMVADFVDISLEWQVWRRTGASNGHSVFLHASQPRTLGPLHEIRLLSGPECL